MFPNIEKVKDMVRCDISNSNHKSNNDYKHYAMSHKSTIKRKKRGKK